MNLVARTLAPAALVTVGVRFGPDECAYVVDYGAVRDLGSDTHFVGAANGQNVQIPGTGVIWKIWAM